MISRRIFGAFVSLWLVGTLQCIAARADDQQLIDDFTSYLRELVGEDKSTAFAYAFFSPRGTLIEIISGEGANGQALTADSALPLGTASVVVNSLLLAAMEHQGILDIDRPIRTQLTGFRATSDAHTRALTLRHLLTMTSGLVDYADTLLPADATPADLLALLRQAPYAANPGTLLQPNLTSPAAAGYIAVAIAQSSPTDDLAAGYRAALQKHLATPLNLRATSANAAGGGLFMPADGLQSSLSDLRTILQTELRDGMSPHNTRIISPSQAHDRRQSQRLPDNVNVAHLGWQRQAHLRTEFLICASYDDHSAAVLAISPNFNYGWVCLTIPGGNRARMLVEDVVLSSVELTRQLALSSDPSLLTGPGSGQSDGDAAGQ